MPWVSTREQSYRLASPKLLTAVKERRNMSHSQLAARVGVNRSFISHLIAGRSGSCKRSTAEALAKALSVPVDLLFDAPLSTRHRQ